MSRTRGFLLLLLAVLAVPLIISSCGGGGGGSSSPTAPPAPAPPVVVVVQVRDFGFEPRSITVQPGDTVRWVLAGADRTHTVSARDGSFDSGVSFSSAAGVFERRFDTAGTWEYWCSSHRDCCSMQGSVRVGTNSPPPIPGYE